MQPIRKPKRRVANSVRLNTGDRQQLDHLLGIWAKHHERGKSPRHLRTKSPGIYRLIVGKNKEIVIVREYGEEELELVTLAVRDLTPNNSDVLRAEIGVKIEDSFRGAYRVTGKNQAEKADKLSISLNDYKTRLRMAREDLIADLKYLWAEK